MKTEIDFKNLWQQQPVNPPDIEALLVEAREFKIKNMRKMILANLLLIATGCFIIFIWYYYQPQLMTTKMGIVLILLAMVLYLFFYNKLFNVLKTISSNQTNKKYLENLIEYNTKQRFLQTTLSKLYFIMLSLGLALYMIEYTLLMSLFWALITYALTLGWIAFCWFYIAPKTIRKQQGKLDELINRFKKINHQLKP